ESHFGDPDMPSQRRVRPGSAEISSSASPICADEGARRMNPARSARPSGRRTSRFGFLGRSGGTIPRAIPPAATTDTTTPHSSLLLAIIPLLRFLALLGQVPPLSTSLYPGCS